MWERAGGFTGGQTGTNTPEEGQLNMSLCLYTGLGRDGPYQTGQRGGGPGPFARSRPANPPPVSCQLPL